MTDETTAPVEPNEAPTSETPASGPQLNIAENGLYAGMDTPDLDLLDGTEEPEAPGAPAEKELEPEPPPDPVPTHFIGELDETEVLAAIKLAQQVPDIRANVERSVMGRLGPIAKELKDLRASGLREFSFDPETSPGLKELIALDSGIGTAMQKVLAELKVNSLDVKAAVQPLLNESLPRAQAEMHDRFQDDLLLQFVPDAFDVGPTPEFATFMRTQPLDVQDVLQGWGQEGAQVGQKNARTAIGAFLAFKAEQKAVADAKTVSDQKKKVQTKNLQRSVEDGQSGNGGAGTTSGLSEQEALDTRMKDQGLPFYLNP